MIDLEVSPGAQVDAAAEEQLVDGHLTVPGGLEWDETSPKRHTIANLRYAGGKEHNVRYVSEVDYDAALAREAALRAKLDEWLAHHVKVSGENASLQQRLAVAEKLLRRVHQADALSHCCPLWKAIDAALKPAEVNSVSCKFDWVKK